MVPLYDVRRTRPAGVVRANEAQKGFRENVKIIYFARRPSSLRFGREKQSGLTARLSRMPIQHLIARGRSGRIAVSPSKKIARSASRNRMLRRA